MLFDILSDEELTTYFQEKEYSSSSIIFNEGEKCLGISFILSGEVLIVTSTYNEKEEIINFLSDSDVFGDVLCFSSNPFYMGNIIAKKKTKILFLPIENFYKLANKNPLFLSYILSTISDKTIEIKNETKLLCHKNIKDRIIYYLNFLSKKGSSKEINIGSVENFASAISLPRPSVSRELSKLEKDGLIKKNKNIITILF